MKKQIEDLGKALNKLEQKRIKGATVAGLSACDEDPSSLDCICEKQRKPRLAIC